MQGSGQNPVKKRNYASYLLRCWRPQDTADWRFVLEEVIRDEKINFDRLSALIAYLEQKFQARDPQSYPPSETQSTRREE